MSKAQYYPVSVTSVIYPPFSPRLSYYLEHSNQVNISLLNISDREVQVYVSGRLKGDNGVEIYTEEGYKPADPLTLYPGRLLAIDRSTIEQVFSFDHLVYEGIKKEDIIRDQGLPEGNYQMCFVVYDYVTGEPLSDPEMMGCSNMFPVQFVDPPIILYPKCDSVIATDGPQNILFSWSLPVGAQPGFGYRFVMVEVYPESRNPNDALASATPPYFFETQTNINQLIMGESEPQLMEGRRYAFAVQAYDPTGNITFKNNGFSEVCSFVYRKRKPMNFEVEQSPKVTMDGWSEFVSDLRQIPTTTISGRILTKLAGITDIPPSNIVHSAAAVERPSQTTDYDSLGSDGGVVWGSVNENRLAVQVNSGFKSTLNYNPPLNEGTINEEVIDLYNAEPLRNTRVRLVARFFRRYANGEFVPDGLVEVAYSKDGNVVPVSGANVFYDVYGNEIPWERVENTLGKVLDVTTTDDQGNFTFNFQSDFFTGPVYSSELGDRLFGNPNYLGFISLKVEVENQKFCSPDVDVFTSPGKMVNLNTQVALIKDYNMELVVKSAYDRYTGSEYNHTLTGVDDNKKIIPGGQPIPNAEVTVMRDMQEIAKEHPVILASEGVQPGTIEENNDGRFMIIFRGATDESGRIKIPHLVKRWDISDGANNSPYYFRVRTRSEEPGSSYESTFYNFERFFGKMSGLELDKSLAGMGTDYDDAGNNNYKPVTYNRFYVPFRNSVQELKMEARLKALPPEIKGRLVVKSNLENVSVADFPVRLYAADQGSGIGNMEALTYSNSAGFFRFANLMVKNDQNGEVRGPFRSIQIISPLYKNAVYPPADSGGWNLRYGQLKFVEVQLEPRKELRGKVMDENGQPVAAYVKRLPDSPYSKTSSIYEYDENGNSSISGEYFEVPVSPYSENLIEILPLSNQYFPDTFSVSAIEKDRVHVFRVQKKLHRLRIQLYDQDTHAAISGARVEVGDSLAIATTTQAGTAELLFASPGEQFFVRISHADYSPFQTVFKVPVGKNWHSKTVELKYALHISGTVSDESTGLPISGAKVYSHLQNTNGNNLYIEALTDDEGYYELKGLPWYTIPTTITVKAVKSGNNPSYIGQELQLEVKNSMRLNAYDFQLKRADGWDFSSIWGLPVVVEEMTTWNSSTMLSGYFFNLPHVPGVNVANSDEKIYFKNVGVKKGNDGKIEVLAGEIKTRSYGIPVQVEGGYYGNLFSPFALQNNCLKVTSVNNRGRISGALKIDLASFNFAYDFHGDLYLGMDTTSFDFPVFEKRVQGEGTYFSLVPARYWVYSADGHTHPVPLSNYRVFGFRASSGFKEAYWSKGIIHIGATLHTDIPLENRSSLLDLKIRAGEIQISRDNIDFVENTSGELHFDLEKWNVESSAGWKFDKTRDALVLPHATIYTGLGVEADIRGLNIRPDAIREGEIDLQEGLSLGGIVPVQFDKNVQPVFNYDVGVGHYRISMVGNAQGPVAWVEHLPITDDRLEFTSIGMLSDNTTLLNLGKKMTFHHILPVYVDQIMSGKGFFQLAGMPELDIPGFVPTTAVVTYGRDATGLYGKLEPLSGVIDCNANVVFTLDNAPGKQVLENKQYSAYGTFYIQPPAGTSGDDIQLAGHLVKTPSNCTISVLSQTINMGKEKMEVYEGRISTLSNSWGLLNFKAHPQSVGLNTQNVFEYTVHGGIEAHSDAVKLDQINTPLGTMEMAYLFDERALVGKLSINSNLDLGFAGIKSGEMATRFDPYGYYMGFSGNVQIGNDVYGGGVLLGSYERSLNDVAQPLLRSFETSHPDFSSLNGMYLIGQRSLLDEKFKLLVIKVAAKAGLGVSVFLDFNKNSYQVGGYCYAHLEGGVNIRPCGYVGVNQRALGNITGSYVNNVLSVSGCVEVSACVGACGLDGCLNVLHRVKVSSAGEYERIFMLDKHCSDYE